MNIISRFNNVVTTLILSLVIASCSETATDQIECPITIDSISIIDSIEIVGSTYYLVYRVSGWNDKTEILELYDHKPEFDQCSRSKKPALYGDSLETSQSITHVYLNTAEKKLEIIYENKQPDKAHNLNLKLEVR